MLKLDTPTIIVISEGTDLLLVMMLLHAWRTRTTYAGFLLWAIGIACWTVGSSLTFLLSSLQPVFIPKIIGNSLLQLHPVILYEGMIRFYGLKRRLSGTPLNVVLITAGMLNLAYFLYVSDNLPARVMVNTYLFAFIFGRIAVEPLLHRKIRRHSMQWILSISLVPMVVLLLLRATWYLGHLGTSTTTLALLQSEAQLRWVLVYSFVVEVVIAYSLLSLTSDRLERELRAGRERETLIVEAQRKFFGMITHEFKTPLAVIDRSAQMIAYTASHPDEALTRRVDVIRSNTAQLIGLLDNCMNDVTLATGVLQVNYAQLDLNPLLARVREHSLEVWPLRSIDCSVPGSDSPFRGDSRLLFHLFANLLDNALKFSPADTPVSVRLTSDIRCFVITVTDRGVGVPHGEQASLGKHKFRASSAEGVPGSGIGLHLAKMITRVHNGSLTIESAPGLGTTVTVKLHRRRGNDA